MGVTSAVPSNALPNDSVAAAGALLLGMPNPNPEAAAGVAAALPAAAGGAMGVTRTVPPKALPNAGVARVGPEARSAAAGEKDPNRTPAAGGAPLKAAGGAIKPLGAVLLGLPEPGDPNMRCASLNASLITCAQGWGAVACTLLTAAALPPAAAVAADAAACGPAAWVPLEAADAGGEGGKVQSRTTCTQQHKE
jgi:hypothetical protein